MKISDYLTPVTRARICLLVAIAGLVGTAGLYTLHNSHAATPNNAANTQIWWISAYECPYLSDAKLQQWKAEGIGGFVCAGNYLKGLGGSNDFTGDPNNSLTGSQYDLERSLKNSNIGSRAHALGMKMYLGFYAANYYNCVTPYDQWFDDAGWQSTVLPAVQNIAAAAKMLGFDGLNIDQENYVGNGGCTANWTNTGTMPAGGDVYAEAKLRGQQMMTNMLQSYPGLEVMFYYNTFPEGWEALVQCEVNHVQSDCGDNQSDDIQTSFWDGMSSVEGYSHIRFQDAMFYKSTQRGSGSNWDIALQYNDNRVYAWLSRHWSNWSYAAPRFSISPFAWIDDDCGGEGAFAYNRPANYVASQLAAFRKWGMDGQFSNYTYSNDFFTMDYGNYVNSTCVSRGYTSATPQNYLPSILAAAQPGVVDSDAPTLSINSPTDGSKVGQVSTLNVSGVANDNMAVRYVSWSNDRGGSGTAQMTWQYTGNYNTGYTGQMNWTINNLPLQSGTDHITITAVDIKGLTTTSTITDQDGVISIQNDTPTLTTPAPVSTPAPTPPPAPAATSSLSLPKITAPPTIDGDLSEYSAAPSVAFTKGSTTATVRGAWDANNLYLAYHVVEPKLDASIGTRDGPVWGDDAVEWFIDTHNDGGGSSAPTSGAYMLSDDYQGIVNLLNTQFDDRGSDTGVPVTTWDGNWQSAVATHGTINQDGDTDTGYDVEVKIPWTTLGYTAAPTNDSQVGMDFALDSVGSGSLLWPNTTTAFQNVTKWPKVTLSGQTITPPAPVTTSTDITNPGIPTNLHTTTTSTTTTSLSWSAATDNVGVTGYRVYRGTTQVATTTNTSFTDSGLTPASNYTYTVVAFDAAGNVSAASSALTATTALIPGDVNGDNKINIFDLSILSKNWGQSGMTRAQGDLNGDGVVNIFDLALLSKYWGTAP